MRRYNHVMQSGWDIFEALAAGFLRAMPGAQSRLPSAPEDRAGAVAAHRESRLTNSTRRWPTCFAPTRTRSSGWRRYPVLGPDSAQPIIAAGGATAATFPSEADLAPWVGACPGDDETAGVSRSHRSPKGDRHMRRILNRAANVAVKYISCSWPRNPNSSASVQAMKTC